MGKQSNRKKINRCNKKRWLDAASGLWDLAANRQSPNAMRILAEMVGLDKIALLLILKSAGDRTIDAEAVQLIAGAIERDCT
ncbi:hypothetical protein NDI43_27550 [Microcoleus vaginatus GB2-A3]|uniref:hypothetical protein n=1 Tax=Microcoleus vaginatus TaxID=119532 RepID=UPI0032A84621